MSNQMYAKGREAFLEGSIAGLSDTLACSLVSSSYTVNLSTDQFYHVISGGAINAGPVSLTSVTGSAGTLSAANTVFSSVSGSAASGPGPGASSGSAARAATSSGWEAPSRNEYAECACNSTYDAAERQARPPGGTPPAEWRWSRLLSLRALRLPAG